MLYHYITGYVNITVEGYFIERFINICNSQKILLWNIKKKNSSIVTANMGIHEFKKIKEIARKTKCRIHLNKKKGIPFFLHRYQKRKLFAFMLGILMISILILSNFIWNIEVTGNVTISTGELIQELEQQGLTIGQLKGKVDTQKIINQIRLNRNDIAWIGIAIEGTNAKVEVAEADEKPDIINEEDYCNIVSDKEGVIVKISSKNGTPVAKVGDVLKKGSILIGGWMEGKYTGTRYLHSEGEILARVWYSKKEKMNLTQEEAVNTRSRREKVQYPYS